MVGAMTNRLTPDKLKSVLAQTKEVLTTSMSPMDMARRAFDPFNLLDSPALTNLSGISIEQGQKMFASSEGKFRLVFVQSSVDLAGYRSCESWLKAIQAVVARVWAEPPKEKRGGGVVRSTGRPGCGKGNAPGMAAAQSGSRG